MSQVENGWKFPVGGTGRGIYAHLTPVVRVTRRIARPGFSGSVA